MDMMFISGLARMPLGLVETWDQPVIAVLAIGPTLVGAALYFFFLQRRPELKNSAYIPMALGVILGLVSWFDSTRPGVRDFGDFGRKITMMFMAMWILPIIAGVGLFVWDKFGRGGRRVNY